MPADLLSNFIGMTLQATGNNNNAWGTILNGSALTPLKRIQARPSSPSNPQSLLEPSSARLPRARRRC
jgi:hypothetical protein